VLTAAVAAGSTATLRSPLPQSGGGPFLRGKPSPCIVLAPKTRSFLRPGAFEGVGSMLLPSLRGSELPSRTYR